MTSATRLIRVLIVDDHDMLREGLATFLKAFKDMEMVGEASNGREAILLAQSLSPDVILMDLVMPELDGVSAIREIHATNPNVRIIALSSFGEDRLVREALRNGATGYLLKNISANNLAEAIRAASGGLSTLAPEVAAVLVSSPAPSAVSDNHGLTHRELEVLRLLVAGATNAEIGRQLAISTFTAKNHVSSIFSKLGVATRSDAVRVAIQGNLVQMD